MKKDDQKKTNKKCGIVITYHNHANDFVIPCLNSILSHTQAPRYILVFDNESKEKDAINIPQKYHDQDINFIRINNQRKNGGLTGTWNQGIDICFNNGCDKVILLNHDTVVDESWNIYINAIKENKCVYGPISNDPGNDSRYNQKNTKEYSLKNKTSIKKTEVVNGFCLGFTKKTLENNKFDKKYYFDPKYHFGNNEFEWQIRHSQKGGISKVVEGCFVYHYKDNAWAKKFRTEPLRNVKTLKALVTDRKYLKINLTYWIGIIGVILKKRIPIIYRKLKPYFPDKDINIK